MSSNFNITDFILNPPQEFALLGLPNGDLKVFSGPFKALHSPQSEQVNIYYNDFFLSNPAPFLSCRCSSTISATQRRQVPNLPDFKIPHITWSEDPQIQFLESYSFFRNLLDKHEIKKAVPTGFSYGTLQSETLENLRLSSLLYKLVVGQAGLYSYAIKYKNEILVGASPEILCEIDKSENKIRTEAVAGSIIKTHAPLSDITGKLKEEHELVVKDLEDQLSYFGKVEKGEITLKNLSSLSHLRTELQVNYTDKVAVQALIDKLHPSGALGILPRVNLSHPYIKALDLSQRRGSFGAPFGAIFEDGSACLIVAIRNLIFSGNHVLLGAGAGITKQSEPNSELAEVLAKQSSVKSFFGL